MAIVKFNPDRIIVRCKTKKEFYTMIKLIVYIQSAYREKFSKQKKISLRKVVNEALKELEKRGEK